MATPTARLPLTRSRVLDAAVELADSHGIDAVTLRRLAEALGVHPTSIYNHLPSKEAILDGVSERLVEQACLGAAFPSWREWVRSFAHAMRGLAQAHPGAFAVFTRRPAQGPGADAHLEAALDAFRRAGFAPRAANEAVTGVSLALMGLALNEGAVAGPATPGLAHLLPERYPRISEAAQAVPASTDGVWDLMVAALIRGLETA
ncbi:MAG: TetR/AcrR family transcriptional regulator [Actinomycetota bacterium]|nr:TetR/AcrR family transcriptional regulator [Actinomycetota bacterium]